MDIGNEVLQTTYEIATQEADTKVATMQAEMEVIREESQAIGVLQKINYDNAHNELLKYVTLYNIKQSKEYKKGGMNWGQFCEAIGQPRRSVETRLRDLQPLFEEFTAASAALTSIPFNKIR